MPATRGSGNCARRRGRDSCRAGARSRRSDESLGSRGAAVRAIGSARATSRRTCRTCAGPARATRRFAAGVDGVNARNSEPRRADGTRLDSPCCFRGCTDDGNATGPRSCNASCNQRDAPRCPQCSGISTSTCGADAEYARSIHRHRSASTCGFARCSVYAARTGDLDGPCDTDSSAGTGSESLAGTGRAACCTG